MILRSWFFYLTVIIPNHPDTIIYHEKTAVFGKSPIVSLINYFDTHPEIQLIQRTDAPDEDKSVGDSRLLIPILKDFFKKHPLINPDTFLGDAAFDSTEIYKALLTGDSFGKTADGSPRIFL